MNWTTEVPKQTGYYWTWAGGAVLMAEVIPAWHGKGLGVFLNNHEHELEEFTHWMGPLDTPKSPTETINIATVAE